MRWYNFFSSEIDDIFPESRPNENEYVCKIGDRPFMTLRVETFLQDDYIENNICSSNEKCKVNFALCIFRFIQASGVCLLGISQCGMVIRNCNSCVKDSY